MSSSSNNHYIRAETSARIDACFGGVVVQSPGNKFQYFQDRNKRWPFTCSEKGCACLRVFFSSPLSLFQSLSPIFSPSFFFCKRARAVCVCVFAVFARARLVRRRLSSSSSSSSRGRFGRGCFVFSLLRLGFEARAENFLFFFFDRSCATNNSSSSSSSNGLTFLLATDSTD